MKWLFFGTPALAVRALEILSEKGIVPSLIVTAPDKPQGRGLRIDPSPVKAWAEQKGIEVLAPETLRDESFQSRIRGQEWDFFLVFAYGKILPSWLLDLPKHGTLNIHPSLLPKFRGPSPIESFILSGEKETGVTIMKIDEEVDHGPVLSQKTTPLPENIFAHDAEMILAEAGAELFADSIREYLGGTLAPKEQNHAEATYTKKYSKEDGLVTLDEDPKTLWKKFRAFTAWPSLYFFAERNGNKIRVKIRSAEFDGESFVVKTVVPEGKREMPFADFSRSV